MNNLMMEDDDFFIQPNSASLQGLFGPLSIDKSENNDLTYAAPKQPKSAQKQKIINPPVKMVVGFAKVVHVYKRIDNSYKTIGKYGLALISDTIKLAQILLYKDKQSILTKVTLDTTEIYIEDNYVSFTDSNNEKWYVQFDEDKDLNEFLKELKQNNIKFVEVIKEELVTPTTADVLNENVSSEISDKDSETSNITQTRADILSRMAKMGQSVLPGNIKNESNNVIDEHPTSPKNIRKLSTSSKATDNQKEISHAISNANKKNNNVPSEDSSSPLIMNKSLTPAFQYTQAYPQNMSLVNPMIPSQEYNMLISENRIQNTEVRMNLTALSSKLDTVLNEISKIKEPPNTDKLENEFLKSKIVDLEKQISNLTRKVNENNQSSSTLESLVTNKNQEIENEKKKVLELQSTLKNMEDLESKVSNYKMQEVELNILISDLKQQIENSRENIAENDVKYAKLQEINETIVKDKLVLNDELQSMVMDTERRSKISQEKAEQEIKYLSNIIKESMNLMYQNIMSQHENSALQQNQFKAILSTNIKQATFNVIDKFRSYSETISSPNSKGPE